MKKVVLEPAINVNHKMEIKIVNDQSLSFCLCLHGFAWISYKGRACFPI